MVYQTLTCELASACIHTPLCTLLCVCVCTPGVSFSDSGGLSQTGYKIVQLVFMCHCSELLCWLYTNTTA